ncbi:MAG TPA: vitamin K epoxide reductase family protein, partial [Chloroflexota bacterium]|nr:vitamin K epoxide reductase family protein [Chloroflexota bacterium]
QAQHDQHDHHGMGKRGVTRMPMSMGDMDGQMSAEDRQHMLHQHHRQTLWIPFTVMLLGIWLMTSPAVLGYGNNVSPDARLVTLERDLWPTQLRASLMIWNDIISGALLVVLGFLWLRLSLVWAPWIACFVGIWLLFAPLVLWSPSAAAYQNDNLVGILVIALTILIPGMPGMILVMKMGPEVPPGWTYNPSSWLQRLPVIALGFVGLFASRHLAAYQLGYIPHAWDPFFGAGTQRILESDVSRAWPISDAGLGVVAYTLEALMGFMGSPARWRTMPWMVLFFGILVVPLGLVSIALVIMQPVAVGTWCTICLFTALAMLIMIPLTLDEVVAMLQFMVRGHRAGKPFWSTFWKGGADEGGGKDERSPEITAPPAKSSPAMVWGVTVPWNLMLSALIGMWLMAAPDVLGTQGSAGNSNHLVGATIVVVSVICMAEVARAGRFLNLALGAWTVVAPWVLAGASDVALWSSVLSGLAVMVLSLPRGPMRERYGGWDRYVF